MLARLIWTQILPGEDHVLPLFSHDPPNTSLLLLAVCLDDLLGPGWCYYSELSCVLLSEDELPDSPERFIIFSEILC